MPDFSADSKEEKKELSESEKNQIRENAANYGVVLNKHFLELREMMYQRSLARSKKAVEIISSETLNSSSNSQKHAESTHSTPSNRQ